MVPEMKKELEHLKGYLSDSERYSAIELTLRPQSYKLATTFV